MPTELGEATDEPPLPTGLGEATEEPPVSAGLGEGSDEPELPSGLDESSTSTSEPVADAPAVAFVELSGFLDARAGWRLQSDPLQQSRSLSEARLQVQLEGGGDRATFRLTTDFVYDDLSDEHGIDLERGQGPIDLREALVALRPLLFADVKAGRQVLSWGTGDLIFINDLFPKDYQSFFVGRDVEYLKAPSDAGKLSLFFRGVNLDLVYTPRFDPDRFIDGSRLSFYNPFAGAKTGQDVVLRTHIPGDPEFALRLYGNLGIYELAAYGYYGFWKSPAGYDPDLDAATFPELSVYGFSLRGPLWGGIANFEAGYYESRDDPDGDDPLVRNSDLRALLGYQRELITDLTLGVQGELERMRNYGAYRRSLPPGAPAADRDRYLFTLRLTKRLLDQDLSLSFFAFYSPTDEDAYLRPKVHYRVNDHLSLETGGNLFFGNRDDTFLGQLEDNTNLYLAVRYSFAADLGNR